jgi:thiazole synthase
VSWTLYDRPMRSRMLLGTARYPSPASLAEAVRRAGVDMVTVSLRRQTQGGGGEPFAALVCKLGVSVLPNTAGCRTADEAVRTARLAREMFDTPFLKLEVIADESTLQPDPFETVAAAEVLASEGFCVLPYVTTDLALGARLVALGCRVLMPWASPIGAGRGIVDADALRAMRHRFPDTRLIVDAGLGRPSHAAAAMELGFDGVLLNTAVALADDPPAMAEAFALAVRAGRAGWEAGLMVPREVAVPSTPAVGLPFRLT